MSVKNIDKFFLDFMSISPVLSFVIYSIIPIYDIQSETNWTQGVKKYNQPETCRH